MSAATMMACAADEIILGKHSFLGPIDPQLVLSTPMGQRMVSAEDILDQFKRAKKECQEPGKLAAWLPMLNQYGPDLLVKCTHACKMAKTLVQEWLEGLMFKDIEDKCERKAKAAAIAKRLSAHRCLKSHHRHIPRTELESWGLRIGHLEKDQELQDLVLSVFHATTHTFAATGAVKIIENHLGKAFITMRQAQPALVVPGRPFPPAGAPKQA
jgi:hypothetical protein